MSFPPTFKGHRARGTKRGNYSSVEVETKIRKQEETRHTEINLRAVKGSSRGYERKKSIKSNRSENGEPREAGKAQEEGRGREKRERRAEKWGNR